MVGSVLNYASEIWNFRRANDIEQVHNRFCRFVLKLSKHVPLSFVCGELGHLPMYVSRKQIILKFWLHIIVNKTPIVYDVYQLY